jgi:hypothetical protein
MMRNAEMIKSLLLLPVSLLVVAGFLFAPVFQEPVHAAETENVEGVDYDALVIQPEEVEALGFGKTQFV